VFFDQREGLPSRGELTSGAGQSKGTARALTVVYRLETTQMPSAMQMMSGHRRMRSRSSPGKRPMVGRVLKEKLKNSEKLKNKAALIMRRLPTRVYLVWVQPILGGKQSTPKVSPT